MAKQIGPRQRMAAKKTPTMISRHEMESWLSRALVPVEPDQAFLRRLRARLVDYRGRRPVTVWALVAVLAAMLLILAGTLGFVLRLTITVLGLVGWIGRARRRRLAERTYAG